jgi:DNA primase
MQISQIKQNLTLEQVLAYYELEPDKNNRMNCPFHEDKTPSLQVYKQTQTAFCFSSNCKTHGKSMDVIDFIMYKQDFTKAEAINKAKEMIDTKQESKSKQTKENLTREQFLTNMFAYFKNAIYNSKPAKDYLQSRNLDFSKLEIGYNSGQFHHGERKTEEIINQALEVGLLIDKGLKDAYGVFGKWCIVFALRSPKNEIVSLYFRSILNSPPMEGLGVVAKHFYLKDRQGIYPNYPNPNTKKLILTESIIDAASLLQALGTRQEAEEISVVACYGTNGFTEEHQKSIKDLKELEEIIFFLNGDEAGNKAVAKYAPMLKAEYPNLKITSIAVQQNEDVNSLLQGHSPEILTHLIDTRKEIDFIFSSEKSIEKEKPVQSETFINTEKEPVQEEVKQPTTGLNTNNLAKRYHEHQQKELLDVSNPYNLKYQGNTAMYQIKGFRIDQLDSLKITLQINSNA